MHRIILLSIAVLVASCEESINKPRLTERSIEYSYYESKYIKLKDSIFGRKDIYKDYHLLVLSSSNNLKARWTEKLPFNISDSSHYDLESLMGKYEYEDGMISIFNLDSNGDIQSLENYDSVSNYIDSLSILYLKENGFLEKEIEHFKQIRKYIKSEEYIMNSVFKGIGIYHNFYSIDASFSDSIVFHSLSLSDSSDTDIEYAKILIEQRPYGLVEYLSTANYKHERDTNFFGLVSNITEQNLESMFDSSYQIIDSVYYKYNRIQEALEYAYLNRTMNQDSMEFHHKIVFQIK
jgi:hypothetical protein